MVVPGEPARSDSGFSKQDRLLRRSEFLTAQAHGRRVHTPHFVLILYDRGDGGRPRLGITASRKVGKAVQRNRIRRLIREVFRTNKPAFPAGHDCVVVVRENIPKLTFAQVREELLTAVSRRARRSSSAPSSRSGPLVPSSSPASLGAGTDPQPGRSVGHPSGNKP